MRLSMAHPKMAARTTGNRQLKRITATAIVIALVASNASAGEWQRIGPGLGYEQADAYCELYAMNGGRGMVAFGNPNFVAGAMIGGAIGGLIRRAGLKSNCMVLQGWKYSNVVARAKPLPVPVKPRAKKGNR